MSDLSLAVARLIEPEPNEKPGKAEVSSPKGAWISPFLTYGWRPLNFATDRNMLPLILKAVEERGLIDSYIYELSLLIGGDLWSFLSKPTPEQTCRAFLKACAV